MTALSKIFKSIFVRRLSVLLFVLFLFAILQIGCSTLELKSEWRDREITVDGKNTEWLGIMCYFEGSNISVGVLNDANSIYICMIAEDRLMRTQVMAQGFTLWFDPAGGKEKVFGIKFPIGMQAMEGQRIPMGLREEEPDQERIREHFEESLKDLEILGPRKDERKRIPVEEVKGIEIAVDPSGGLLVYELKVPLLHSEPHPYAVGAEAGDLIGVGLEIPKMDWNAMRERMGGRGPGGIGMPPGGGRRGGMGGMPGGMGMGGGRRPQMPKGLKVWVSVQLASGDSLVTYREEEKGRATP